MFKVGDKVKYIKHSEYFTDNFYFKINNIYTIKRVRGGGTFYLDNTTNFSFVFSNQIELWNPCEEALQGILDE